MNNQTDKLLKLYYYLIDQILNMFSDNKRRDKPKLNEAFKAYFRLKYGTNYSSLTEYSKEDLYALIQDIFILFSREYGIYLRQPRDPENVGTISLSEYFEYKRWTLEMNDFDGIAELPKGTTLATSLEDLKRLKPGRRSWKVKGNVEYNFGIPLYCYSEPEDLYYKKSFSKFTPIDLLEDLIKKQLIYIIKPQT